MMMGHKPVKPDDCLHTVQIKGLCGHCGTSLEAPQQGSSVSMIHSVPELKVSKEYAREIGRADQDRLIHERKLVLLVDLDQTLLHTTHKPVRNDPNVHSFQLWPGHPTYYTKLRPFLKEFLEDMSNLYELHIFTFGCRMYAHKIASIIDPDKVYFGNRILSRDESVDQYYKKGNLNNLFPCGDAMVCIIDDRADVWRDAGNLIQVKAYSYFKTSISDGAMLGLSNETSKEDEASLERDVDQLEALLGLNNEDDSQEQPNKRLKLDHDPDLKHQAQPVPTTSGCTDLSIKREGKTVPDDTGETQTTSSSGIDETQDTEESSRDSEEDGVKDDPDDYLKEKLPRILTLIHKYWYEELKERETHLSEGEYYRLPDIKDIIKTRFRKYY